MSGQFCGSGWNFTLVPDSYRGSVSFTPACKRHDACYGICGKTKSQCDNQFGEDLRNACLAAYRKNVITSRQLSECFARAALYQNAVEWGGGEAYRKAQENCKCSQ